MKVISVTVVKYINPGKIDEINKEIEDLVIISKHYDNMATVKKMKEIVPEYKSNNSIYEELDK